MSVPGVPPFNVYGFHIPLFFFLSGMTLSAVPPMRALFVRDTRALLLYALVHFGIFAAITALVFRPWGFAFTSSSPLDWHTYLVLPFTKNAHHVQLFLIAWFLIALYFARALSVVLLKGVLRLPARVAVGAGVLLALLLAGGGMHVFARTFAQTQLWYWNLATQVCVGAAFCLLGYFVQHHARVVLGGKALAVAIGCFLLIVVSRLPPFVMAWSEYPGGFLRSIAFAALGTTMVLCAAHALRHQPWLRTIGRESKHIMAWHLTVFASINLLLASRGVLDPGQYNAFTLFESPRWWPVYLLASAALPIAGAMLLRRLRATVVRDRASVVPQ
jgi:fucose 4-O-acetylase-like acetyltransferase